MQQYNDKQERHKNLPSNGATVQQEKQINQPKLSSVQIRTHGENTKTSL